MWVYFQTILVYLFLAWSMASLGRKYVRSNKFGYIVAAVGIYSIIFGFRYGVGGDFFSYLGAFDEIVQGKQFPIAASWEKGFYYLMRILAFFKSSSLFFSCVAFLQLFFIVLAIKDYKHVYPYLFLAFILTGTWLGFANITRQIISMGFWVLSLRYAIERKPVQHYALIVAAILFHNSAVLLLPFYPIILISSNWFKSVRIELVLLAITLSLISVDVLQDFIERFDYVIRTVGYDHYIENRYDLVQSDDVHMGIGFYISIAINVVIILYSEFTKSFYKRDFFNLLYSLYFLGTLLHYLFINSLVFSRVIVYLYYLQFVIVGFMLYYLYASRKTIPFYVLMSLMALTFVALMYRMTENWTVFVFNWQEDLFHYHQLHDFR